MTQRPPGEQYRLKFGVLNCTRSALACSGDQAHDERGDEERGGPDQPLQSGLGQVVFDAPALRYLLVDVPVDRAGQDHGYAYGQHGQEPPLRLFAHPVSSFRGLGEPAHLPYLLDALHGNLVLPRRAGLSYVPPIEQVPDRHVALGRPRLNTRRLRRALVRGRVWCPDRDGFEGIVPREVVERSQEAPRVVLYAAGRHAPPPLLRERSQCVRFRCTLPAARRNRQLLKASWRVVKPVRLVQNRPGPPEDLFQGTRG